MGFRNKIYITLFQVSENWYRKHFKRNVIAWQVTLPYLKSLNKNLIGYKYYFFLKKNGLNMLPKLETHDMFHVLTNANTEVKTELALQYYLLGNGKRSVYQAAVIISSICYLDQLKLFIKAYKNGKKSKPFHHLDFEKLLQQPLDLIRTEYNIIPINN